MRSSAAAAAPAGGGSGSDDEEEADFLGAGVGARSHAAADGGSAAAAATADGDDNSESDEEDEEVEYNEDDSDDEECDKLVSPTRRVERCVLFSCRGLVRCSSAAGCAFKRRRERNVTELGDQDEDCFFELRGDEWAFYTALSAFTDRAAEKGQ